MKNVFKILGIIALVITFSMASCASKTAAVEDVVETIEVTEDVVEDVEEVADEE